MKTTSLRWFVLIGVAIGCVDKADFDIVTQELPLIIEGMVTDDTGPDTVKISKAYPADGGYYSARGISGATVTISSDAGEAEILTDIGRGMYVTSSLQGVVGRTYRLAVSVDGQQYRSTPQRMLPAGEIDTITFEFTSKTNSSTGLKEDAFQVFVNSRVGTGSSRRLRYKIYGTYKVTTNPELIQIRGDCATPPCPTEPLACAANCECCVCWVSERETSPKLLDPDFVGGTSINRIPIHYIPINNYTFNERYRVEVAQMELSQDAYDFYAAISKQINNASSLFQPPFFELKGNVEPVSLAPRIVGVFSAAAVTKKSIYIYRGDVPYDMTPEAIAADCRAVAPNSTNQMPPFWR